MASSKLARVALYVNVVGLGTVKLVYLLSQVVLVDGGLIKTVPPVDHGPENRGVLLLVSIRCRSMEKENLHCWRSAYAHATFLICVGTRWAAR
jgi:hypothetical protein